MSFRVSPQNVAAYIFFVQQSLSPSLSDRWREDYLGDFRQRLEESRCTQWEERNRNDRENERMEKLYNTRLGIRLVNFTLRTSGHHLPSVACVEHRWRAKLQIVIRGPQLVESSNTTKVMGCCPGSTHANKVFTLMVGYCKWLWITVSAMRISVNENAHFLGMTDIEKFTKVYLHISESLLQGSFTYTYFIHIFNFFLY